MTHPWQVVKMSFFFVETKSPTHCPSSLPSPEPLSCPFSPHQKILLWHLLPILLWTNILCHFLYSNHLSIFQCLLQLILYHKFTTQFTTVMHTISHSLAQQAPPAIQTWACWQPYNAIQSLSACSLQVIFIPLHHLYHQHLQLHLKCSPYPKTTVFKILSFPLPH